MLRFVVTLIVWGATFLVLLPFFFWVGPNVENILTPINREMEITKVERRGTKLCWTFAFMRMKEVTPLSYSYMVYADPRQRYVTDVRRADGTRLRTDRSVPLQQSVAYSYCAELPDHLQNEPNLTVSGFGEYRTFHPLWTIRVQFPPVILGTGARERAVDEP